MKERIILIGGGGHSKSVIESIKSIGKFEIVGILDTYDKVGSYIYDIKIIGVDSDLKKYYNQGVKNAFVTLGSVGDPALRIKLYNYAYELGFEIPNIIDKTAIISPTSVLGKGNFIGKGAIVNCNTYIGNNSIINTGCIVDHDCKIEDFVHVAPGTVLSGGVSIGKNTHIGTNSTIIHCIEIGSNTTIGAGSVVVKNIGSNIKAYGNPCKEVD
ncbi:acetyltransferase [Paraclostridium bifermentans]|uniref:acetyltransferase n=1 Tax=Paraclostridium bifermentans TaxID=1490 RepID=UPI0022E597B3|nr:acetyltransferase [Paraclostridium bifermentans]